MYSVKRIEDKTTFNIPKNNAFVKGMITFVKLFSDVSTFTFSSSITQLQQTFNHQKHALIAVHPLLTIDTMLILDKMDIRNKDYHLKSTYVYTTYIKIDRETKYRLNSIANYVVLRSSTRSFIAGFVSGMNQILGSKHKIQIWIVKNNKVYVPKVIYLTKIAMDAREFRRLYPCEWRYYYWQCIECRNYNYPRHNYCSFCQMSSDIKCNVRIEIKLPLDVELCDKTRNPSTIISSTPNNGIMSNDSKGDPIKSIKMKRPHVSNPSSMKRPKRMIIDEDFGLDSLSLLKELTLS